MTIYELLNLGASELEKISDTPRLDSNILLTHTLKISREKLLASYRDNIDNDKLESFLSLIRIRKKGYPVSYILKEKEFYGLNFYVEPGVLTPRPDTEILVETAIKIIKKNKFKSALDLCTGTGCIAISIKNELSDFDMTAVDISEISERVFNKNNKKIVNESINFIRSDLFTKLTNRKFDIIVTNPPYLTTKESDDRVEEGWKEPVLALDGGSDGLDLIRTIIKESPVHLNSGGWLLIEADPDQMDKISDLMTKKGFISIEVFKDLPGFNRIIVGRYE